MLVTHYYPSHRGGVEIVAGKIATYLTQLSAIKIRWFASATDLPPKNFEQLHCHPAQAINLLERYLQLPYPLWNFLDLWRLAKSIKEADIVHVHDYLYLGNLVAIFAARLCRKPIILTQHIGFIPYDSLIFRWLLHTLNQTLGKFILSQVTQVVFISETVQKYFSERQRFCHPPRFISNGVDSQVFTPISAKDRQALRAKFGLSDSHLCFLFVGRFVEKKGLSILHYLAVEFPQVHWYFAGWGLEDPESWQLANVQVFRDRCELQLTPLYQIADLLILPSKGEGFPLVVQEAMSCGTPVLIGDETAQANRKAQVLMLSAPVSGDAVLKHWHYKVASLVRDPTPLQKLRSPVAAFAKANWSWEQCAQQYLDLFQAQQLF